MMGPRGSEGDRMFMVTDEKYVFRTQRRENGGFTNMARVGCRLIDHGKTLTIFSTQFPHLRREIKILTSADKVVQVQVHKDTCDAIDQGDEAADYLSDLLSAPCRLVGMADTFYRRVDPVFSPETAYVSFADAYPVLLISDASLADLNSRLEAQDKEPVSRDNFRSCMWVGGCSPYEEDTWKQIQINGVVFDVVKPCQRCSITQVDHLVGRYRGDKEPLITLRGYRHQTIPQTGQQGVMFGQNLVNRGFGIIRARDRVQVLERK